jgi:putative phage-type endonuclease
MLSKEQLELRRTRITASDVAPILGLSRFKSGADVLAEKLYPELCAFEGNKRTRWGNRAESAILDGYEEDHGVKLIRAAEIGTLVHVDEPWSCATPDALLGSPGKWERVVECKVVGSRMAWLWGEEGTDEVYLPYVCQVAWQLWITNCDMAHVAAVVDGEERLYVIRRDPGLEDMLVTKCHDFYQRHLVNREPLEPDGSDGFRELLLRRYPHHAETVIQADPAVEEIALAYRNARAELDAAEAKATRLKQAIMNTIGPHAAIEGSFGKITWRKTADVERLDYRAAFDEAIKYVPIGAVGDIHRRFTKTAPGVRRFVVPRNWGESK